MEIKEREDVEIYVLSGNNTGEVIVREKKHIDSYKDAKRGISFFTSKGTADEAEIWDYGMPSGRWLNLRAIIYDGKVSLRRFQILRAYNFKDEAELNKAISILEGEEDSNASEYDHEIKNSILLQNLMKEHRGSIIDH